MCHGCETVNACTLLLAFTSSSFSFCVKRSVGKISEFNNFRNANSNAPSTSDTGALVTLRTNNLDQQM